MGEARSTEPPPLRMSREEFRAWAERQPRGRFERVVGEIVAMSPQRASHARVKARVWQALERAVRAAAIDCEVFPDGMTVQVSDDSDYEPDALVTCGAPIPPDAVAVPNPVIVVEVTSPSTQSTDSGDKLADYFRVPSIQHYLIVGTRRREVIHHRRAGDRIETRIVASGALTLDPPGLTVAIEDFYPAAPA